MRSRNWLPVLALVTVLHASVEQAQAQACGCATPPPAGANATVSIDARTGRIEGPREAKRSDTVAIRLNDKNPFLYRYEMQVAESVVQEAALAAFLAQLSPLISGVVVPPAGVKPTLERGADGRPQLTCDAADKALPVLTDLLDRYQQLVTSAGTAQGEVAVLEKGQQASRDAYQKYHPILTNSASACSELCDAASKLQAALDSYLLAAERPQTGFDRATARVVSVEVESKGIMGGIDEYRKTFPACQPYDMGRNVLLDIRASTETILLGPAASTRARVESLRADAAKLQTGKELVDRGLATPQNFAHSRLIGPFSRSTDVTITVNRINAADAEGKSKAEIAKHEISFGGGPRFGLSGGVVYSWLRTQEFQQVRGIELNRKREEVNPQTLTTIVGLAQDSSRRVLPMLLLHTRVLRNAQWLHGTFGISAKKDSEGVNVEYIVGPSLSVIDNRVFLTPGLYYGRRYALGGDLYVGAPIPADLTSIPVRKEYDKAFALTVTFRVR